MKIALHIRAMYQIRGYMSRFDAILSMGLIPNILFAQNRVAPLVTGHPRPHFDLKNNSICKTTSLHRHNFGTDYDISNFPDLTCSHG